MNEQLNKRGDKRGIRKYTPASKNHPWFRPATFIPANRKTGYVPGVRKPEANLT